MATRILTTLFCLAAFVAPAAQQTPRELFERARMLEESNSKLPEAIVLYTQVAAQSVDRPLAATAQLRIGLLHERLGQKADAQRAFRAVVERHTDQPELVRQARDRLSPATTARGGFAARRVWEGLRTAPLGSTSADGRYLSFTDWSDGSLAVRDLTAGTMRKLTRGTIAEGFAYGSVLSPDGATAAFNWADATTSALELRTIRLDTQKEVGLYRNEQLNYFQPFDWSRDGSRLLMLFNRLDGTNQIALISVPGGSARVLKTFDWRAPAGMAFSPDGRWIVYDFPSREQARERDLFILAADGSRATRLVEHPADDVVLGWAPDGRTVLFASDRTGTRSAWTIQVKDGERAGEPQMLRAELGSRVTPLGFTRAGAFYYFAATTVSEVYTASIDLSSGRVTAPPAPLAGRFLGAYESADWSPDATSLAIVTQPPGLGDKRLLIHNPATGDDREIPLQLSPANWPRWSRDGTSILLSGRNQKRRSGFFRVDARTGGVTELLVQSSSPLRLRAEWSSDGKSLFFARRDDSCLCVVRRDLSTGDETIVYRAPRSNRQMTLAPSPDGRRVAVLMFDEARQRPMLMAVPFSGGAPKVLYEGEDLGWFNFLTWTPDSNEVLFGRAAPPDKMGVWRVGPAGGKPSPLGLAMEGLRDLRVSPDGRRLVFTAGVNTGDVWVLENFIQPSGSARRQPTGARKR